MRNPDFDVQKVEGMIEDLNMYGDLLSVMGTNDISRDTITRVGMKLLDMSHDLSRELLEAPVPAGTGPDK